MKRLILPVVLLVSACSAPQTVESGHDTGDVSAASVSEDRQYVYDFLSARAAQFDRARPWGQLTDYLPNTFGRRVDAPDSAPVRLHNAAIVLGEIVSVTPGRAIVELPERSAGEEDAQRQREVDFEDQNASARSLHVTIRVDEAFGDIAAGTDLPSGITIGGRVDVERFMNGLLHIGPALFVVKPDNGLLFPEREGTWLIEGNSVLIAEVKPDSTLHWPLIGGPELAYLVTGAHTVEELRARAAEPPRYVDIVGEGATWLPVFDPRRLPTDSPSGPVVNEDFQPAPATSGESPTSMP